MSPDFRGFISLEGSRASPLSTCKLFAVFSYCLRPRKLPIRGVWRVSIPNPGEYASPRKLPHHNRRIARAGSDDKRRKNGAGGGSCPCAKRDRRSASAARWRTPPRPFSENALASALSASCCLSCCVRPFRGKCKSIVTQSFICYPPHLPRGCSVSPGRNQVFSPPRSKPPRCVCCAVCGVWVWVCVGSVVVLVGCLLGRLPLPCPFFLVLFVVLFCAFRRVALSCFVGLFGLQSRHDFKSTPPCLCFWWISVS